MKKIILLVSVILSLNVSTTIATNIPPGSVSGTWTSAGSPYNIQGNIQIPNDSTLTIQPGVTVNFQGTYKLNVQGRLLAIGTVSDTIIFIAANTTNGWRGIRFNNTPVTNDTSKIIFCKLQYGKATGSSPDDCGGALYFNNVSKTIISHSSILNCTANTSGAGIYCRGSILLTTCCPTISYNYISANTASIGGGGIECDLYSNPNIFNNTISGNSANCCVGSSGGGIYCNGSNPVITNNTISNNIASNGGGIYCTGNSPVISNNIISNNTSSIGMGGGVFCDGSSPSISNNSIFNNSASFSGGGIVSSGGNPIINNNKICNNNTLNNGGGIYCTNSSPNINNNIFSNNNASANGGGICCFSNSSPDITNNTIANNSAANGGALYCDQISNTTFRNCILWGNTASTNGAQVFLNDEASDPNFYYCDVQGGSAAFELNGNFFTGTYQNNINADPKFVSPSGGSGIGFNGTTANWSLQITSSCIDAGNPNGTYPATDITGNPRVNVCRIDIGPYEYQTGIPSFFVSLSISQPILCNGAATGGITAIASGGTMPYAYLWSNGQTSVNITGLTAGNYTVTASDQSLGCSLSKSITLTQPPLTSVDAGSDSTIICGKSTHLNAQPNWITLNSGSNAPFYSVFFNNPDTGYAVAGGGGVAGIIYKTTNGGLNWTEQTNSALHDLHSVYFTNTDIGYVAGDAGTILKTINGGMNWTLQTSGTTNNLYSVYFVQADTGYVVGNTGIILKTTNGGTNWTLQTSNTTNLLYSVYFLNANNGYAVGDLGTILKTTDGGINWSTQNSGSSSYYLHSVYFTNANIGYATGMNNSMAMATILKTTNGGLNWSAQNFNASQINSMFFINADTAYAVSSLAGTSKILKTTDGGTNWNVQSSGISNDLNSVYFTDANTGYIVGNNGLILKLNVPVSYSWSPANGLNATNLSNPIANPNATTTYIITATTAKGCTAIDSVIVHVNPIAAEAGSDKTIICGGTAQLDNVTSNYTGPGIITYNWSPATGLNYDTIPNPTATVTGNTKYFVTVTTPNGCTAVDSVSVLVNPLTAFYAISNKTIICGGTAQLDNVTTNYTGTETLTYHWAPATGLNYDTIPNPTATVTDEIKYFVTVMTSNGCTAIDSVTVSVNPLTADAESNKTIICGGTAQLNNVTSNYTGTGTLSYNWVPATGLNYDTIPNPTATVTNNSTYFVTVTTPNGCTAVDSVNVLVNPLIITGTNGTIICGNSTTLNTTTNYTGTDTLTYAWSPSIGLSDSTAANPYVTLTSNQTYTVTVTTVNGCSATDDVNATLIPMNAPEICIVGVDSTNKNLIVWNKPGSLAIDSFYIYRETNITNVYQKIGAVNYDNLSLFVDVNSFPDVQSNKYKISIKDDCGLESARSAYHKTMHLAINQGTGNTWNLIWEAYEGFTVSTYNVYRGTVPDSLQLIGTSSGSNTQYSDFSAPSGYVYYQVEVVSSNFCNPSKSYNSSRSNVATNNPNGIIENSNASDLFSIYPNPVTANLQIQTNLQIKNIEITDIAGRLLYTTTSKIIDCSDFAKGVYFIKIETVNGIAVKKFVKE